MIRFVYFDLGGVVVRDFSASNKWDLIRKDLGISEEDAESFQTFWRVHEREICTTTTLDAMVPILERECHATIPKDYPLLGNFVKYFDKNESIWEVLQEIKEHKKIGLLTSMYVGMFDAISAKEILPNIAWDIIVDSSIVGYAKPDKQIYEIAEKKSGVEKNEILFIDNSVPSIEAAKGFGWLTYFYDSSDYQKSSEKLHEFLKAIS